MMVPVSVYRVGAAGADPSHVFGDEVRGVDLPCAVWLGWLPLTRPDSAGPNLAVAEDWWLTVPPGRSEGDRVRPGDVVSAAEAAGELLARRECGLEAYAERCAGVSDDARLRASSVADSVADDLSAQVGRVRAAHKAWVESAGAADGQSAAGDGCESGLPGDSAGRRRCARAVRDLQEHHLRLHLLLKAVVRIGVFDSANSFCDSRPVDGSAQEPERDDASSS